MDKIGVSADVFWMAGFTDIIKVTKEVDWYVEPFFELGNVYWIGMVFDFKKTFLFKIL